ncbi:MAG: TldD/PmbA family protein [Bacteroidetes bacterium]|nr:TldD/PmbA family protein [Bacteroidota bacterium]MCL5026494.1 TldD/PmbA family protein [Chloroflexota bacterium]
MRDMYARALDVARGGGASYADIRVVRRESQTVATKNGRVEALSQGDDLGFGVRVLVDGSWGFASSSNLNGQEIERATRLALRIARASTRVRLAPMEIGQPLVITDSYHTPTKVDPFAVSLDEKIQALLAADEAMRRVKAIGVAEAGFETLRETKTFASTEGSYIDQVITMTGGGIEALAVGDGDVQKRSYPNSFGRQMGTGGYEIVQEMDLLGNAPRIAEEAAALLTAPQCPSGVTTVILDATQLALQLHESCGHAVELDRVLGYEAGFAGTSFLKPEDLGSYRYGSEQVSIIADATVPGGLGTYGYDDEGVPAQRYPIIQNGMLAGFLTSRETASRLGQASSGAARADGWNRIPIVRMTNVNLEPGTCSFGDLVSDTDEGIYMQTNKSWSIDDRRLNFQFGTEIAWEVKGGKLGRMLKNATYTGITPQFWASCDTVCSREHWSVWGTPNCGKGQPEQIARVGHGTAPARFRKVRVGVLG